MDGKQNITTATMATKNECTQLEHRLAYAYLFLQNLVANIFLRLYLFPHLPGRSMVHLGLLVGARAIFSYLSRLQYTAITGRDFGRLSWWLQGVVSLGPTGLTDLMLGGCYYECTVRGLAVGYCAGAERG
ncbi:hypothetical protein QBC39DRAFT_173518 [Podospora conica]|nr:hypothetical protein QBC39DRAFT_173518 [Schizothecium conicum]